MLAPILSVEEVDFFEDWSKGEAGPLDISFETSATQISNFVTKPAIQPVRIISSNSRSTVFAEFQYNKKPVTAEPYHPEVMEAFKSDMSDRDVANFLMNWAAVHTDYPRREELLRYALRVSADPG